MSNCATCGGLIMEPMKSYGYAGKVCNCTPPVYVQQPMNNPKHEPVSEDAERRVFSLAALSLGYNVGQTHTDDNSFAVPETIKAWELWKLATGKKCICCGRKPSDVNKPTDGYYHE